MTTPVEPARFFRLDSKGRDQGEGLKVHFNPTSLTYSLTNTLDQPNKSPKKKQFVSQSSAKLAMQLVYDTTDSGQDVRQHTEEVAKFMEPESRGRRRRRKSLMVVRFSWGAFSFKGMFETYKETIEFFSANGVPLRAKLDITLASQDDVFEFDNPNPNAPDAVDVHPARGLGAAAAANMAGDPASARTIAETNGELSLRFSAGAELTVVADEDLRGPSAFAIIGGGADFGLGATAGGSFGGGGVELQPAEDLPVPTNFGAGASAGVSSEAGAFAGLRASGSRRPARLQLDELRPLPAASRLAADEGATYDVGGRGGSPVSSSLSADVGARASLQSRIQFDD